MRIQRDDVVVLAVGRQFLAANSKGSYQFKLCAFSNFNLFCSRILKKAPWGTCLPVFYLYPVTYNICPFILHFTSLSLYITAFTYCLFPNSWSIFVVSFLFSCFSVMFGCLVYLHAILWFYPFISEKFAWGFVWKCQSVWHVRSWIIVGMPLSVFIFLWLSFWTQISFKPLNSC